MSENIKCRICNSDLTIENKVKKFAKEKNIIIPDFNYNNYL
jgi:hypothetical protein